MKAFIMIAIALSLSCVYVEETIKEKDGFIIDMDGVMYHQDNCIDGARDFIRWLQREEKRFLFLTNSSGYLPKELTLKLKRVLDVDVDESHFYTSGLSTARFDIYFSIFFD